MTTKATTEKTPTRKLNDVMWNMYELSCLSATIHEMANILKRDHFEIIPVKPEDKSEFVNGFYSMNELINVIWDYSDRIKEALDSISDEITEIKGKIAETEGVEHDD